MGAQTVTTIAHLFRIKASFSSRHTFRWPGVCFGAMWDRLDMSLSSTLSSKKVTVKKTKLKKTVPTSSGAMWGRALVCPRFLFFFLFFHLSHRATVDFLHSCNAVNRVDVTPPKTCRPNGYTHKIIHRHVHVLRRHLLG